MATSLTVDELVVIINAQTSDFQKQVAVINNQLNKTTDNTTKMGAKSAIVFGAIAGAAQVLVSKGINLITSSVGDAVRRVDTLNNSQRVFQNLGFSATDTKVAMNNLLLAIKGLPTSLDSAVRGVQTLAATQGDIKLATKTFQALNDGILSMGGTAEMVDGAILQLSQLPMDGPLDAQTWNSLRQNGLTPVFVAMAKESGTSVSKLKDAFGSGELTVKDFTDMLIKMDQKGGGGMKSLQVQVKDATKGIGTSFANMKTAVVRGVGDILKSIGNDKIASSITAIGVGFENALKSVSIVIPQIIAFISGIASSVGDYLGPKISNLINIVQTQLVPTFLNVIVALAPVITFIGQTLVAAIGLAVDIASVFAQILASIFANGNSVALVLVTLVAGFASYKLAMMAATTVTEIHNAAALLLSGSTLALEGSTTLARVAIGAMTKAQILLNGAMKANPIGLLIGLLGGLVAAFALTGGQSDGTKAAQDRLSDAQRRGKQAADDLKTSSANLKDAQFNLEGASLAAARAQKNYNEIVKLYGPDSLEAKEAMHQLKGANNDLADANSKVAAETKKRQQAEKDAAKATADLKKIQQDSKTVMDNLTKSVEQQDKKLNELKSQLQSINGKTYKYTIQENRTVIGSNSAPKTTLGFATGGFTGTGSKYEIAGVVHKGEYVLTQDQVDQSTGLPESFGSTGASPLTKSVTIINQLDGREISKTVIKDINNLSFMKNSPALDF